MSDIAQSFLDKVIATHGDTYDLSEIEYINTRTKITVRCKTHGIYKILPNHLTTGRGCQQCSKERAAKEKLKIAAHSFIEKSSKLHHSKYGYDLVEYKGTRDSVDIVCPKHGVFSQTPAKHLMGRGCPLCGIAKSSVTKVTTEDFVQRAKRVHGDKYDYSSTRYVKAHQLLTIRCPEHGDFTQNPHNHLAGAGCKRCADLAVSYTTDTFVRKSNEVHAGKYDYSKTVYKNTRSSVGILCPEHGLFIQLASRHISGIGCPKCANAARGESQRSNTEEFIAKAQAIHGDKWDYSKTNYFTSSTAVTIICPLHGEYSQQPTSHLAGKGCPTCGSQRSIASRASNKEDFTRIANTVHGTRYCYDEVEYSTTHTKVKIICPEHGAYFQEPASHLAGRGCPDCANRKVGLNNQVSFEEFRQRANLIFDGKYQYIENSYTKLSSKVTIVCPKHGEYTQSAEVHLRSKGCQACTRLQYDEFVIRARAVHGDRYGYNLARDDVDGVDSNITIVCPEHGNFIQSVSGHLKGNGCRQCYVDSTKLSQDEYLESCKALHGNRYGYDEVRYTTIRDKIRIKCPEHGYFEQIAHDHKNGGGCPKCAEYYRNLDNRDPKIPCLLYYIEMKNVDHIFYKVGITTLSVKQRYSSLYLDNITIEHVEVAETNLGTAIRAEQQILDEFSIQRIDMRDVLNNVKGGTECFADDVLGTNGLTLDDYINFLSVS